MRQSPLLREIYITLFTVCTFAVIALAQTNISWNKSFGPYKNATTDFELTFLSDSIVVSYGYWLQIDQSRSQLLLPNITLISKEDGSTLWNWAMISDYCVPDVNHLCTTGSIEGSDKYGVIITEIVRFDPNVKMGTTATVIGLSKQTGLPVFANNPVSYDAMSNGLVWTIMDNVLITVSAVDKSIVGTYVQNGTEAWSASLSQIPEYQNGCCVDNSCMFQAHSSSNTSVNVFAVQCGDLITGYSSNGTIMWNNYPVDPFRELYNRVYSQDILFMNDTLGTLDVYSWNNFESKYLIVNGAFIGDQSLQIVQGMNPYYNDVILLKTDESQQRVDYTLTVFMPYSGSVLWSKKFTQFDSTPALGPDSNYYLHNSTGIYAVSPSNGSIVAQYPSPLPSFGMYKFELLSVDAKHAFLLFNQSTVYAVPITTNVPITSSSSSDTSTTTSSSTSSNTNSHSSTVSPSDSSNVTPSSSDNGKHPHGNGGNGKLWITIGIVLAIIAVVIAAAVGAFFYMKRKKGQYEQIQ